MNAIGWHTNRKLLIIESDDWGSLRMTSREAFLRLKAHGLEVERDPYNRLDALESADDFGRLFEVLDKHRDKNNNPACLTTNTIMANPDFVKIKDSNFLAYHYINLEDTYNKYSDGSLATSALFNGIKNNFLKPQFHGREHLNVELWLEALRGGDKTAIAGFKEHVFGLKTKIKIGNKHNYMATFDYNKKKDKQKIKLAIEEGLKLFEDYFKFKSKTFIAPCYIWNDTIEEIFAKAGVSGIQGISYQYIPTSKGLKKKIRYTGQTNRYGQNYLVRNSFFEPSLMPGKDVVPACLSRINTAFRWGKPAIIGAHRINFMGKLVAPNRDKNLKMLDRLLTCILKQWPNVEFISSDHLIDILNDKSIEIQ